MKSLFIDGTNLAHIHFAANPALDDNGSPIGIVKGFMSAMSLVNRLYLPERIIVFFDGPGGSLQKRKLYKEYKAGRKPRVSVGRHFEYVSAEQADKNYDWQIGHLKDFLDSCGINVIETNNYETDDGIAYVIQQNPEDESVIVSCDKDFYQLVSEKCKIFNPISKEEVNIDYILKKYEIHPRNWLFYRAITGDKSDNIDGVKGFGPKTIKKLFFLDNAKSIGLSIIDETHQVLSEIKLDAAKKRTMKRISELKSNKEKLERNWKLMDLSDPLMPLDAKRIIREKIDNFSPSLGTKTFYTKVATLNIPLNPMMTQEFVRLIK